MCRPKPQRAPDQQAERGRQEAEIEGLHEGLPEPQHQDEQAAQEGEDRDPRPAQVQASVTTSAIKAGHGTCRGQRRR